MLVAASLAWKLIRESGSLKAIGVMCPARAHAEDVSIPDAFKPRVPTSAASWGSWSCFCDRGHAKAAQTRV